MKKFLVSLLVAGLVMFSGNAYAGALADVNLDANPVPITDHSSVFNGSFFPTWIGTSSGCAIGGAASQLDASGKVWFGSAYINSLDDPAIANAGIGADSSSFKTGGGFIGPNGSVGTNANAFGSAENNLTVGVRGFGAVGGEFSGIAGEGTTAQAGIVNIGFDATFGYTEVQGAQGGLGAYEGFAGAALCGTAHADASLTIEGESNVVSARNGALLPGNGVTEGLSSAGYVATTVSSDANTDRDGLGIACVTGGWVAGGVLDMEAHQVGVIQPSSANATASGSYNGSGQMGQDYTGVAQGGVATQITQYPNAVYVQSSGHMTVTSD